MAEEETPMKVAEPESTESENLRKIFAGGLNRQTTDETFKEYFGQYGEMEDCAIVRDKTDDSSRGFGFITYKTIAETDACIRQKKDGCHKLDDKDIEVKRAVPKDVKEPSQKEKSKRVYLGQVKEGLTEEKVKEYFETNYECTCEAVDLVREKKDGLPEGQEPKLRGFGFVNVDCTDACDKIVLVREHTIDGHTIFAKKAEPKGSGGGRGGRGGGRGRGCGQSPGTAP